jgi:hypothetical protein
MVRGTIPARSGGALAYARLKNFKIAAASDRRITRDTRAYVADMRARVATSPCCCLAGAVGDHAMGT